MVAVTARSEVGERIREARLAAGLSQGELAATIGLDRTAIVRIEGGQRDIKALELFGIADALQLPVAHFVNRPPAAMVARRQRLVDGPDSAARVRFRLDAALETHARAAEQLVSDGVLMPVPPPPVTPVSAVEDAVRLAGAVRATLGNRSGPLGPLAEVAERLGLFLTVVELDADGASMTLDGYGVAVIGSVEPGRRRLNAAHELGHHLMQDEYHTDVGVAASRDDRERLIDAFAGELLMPLDDLAKRAAGGGKDVRELLIEVAADYRVSWTVAVDGARLVELVGLEQAQRLRAKTPVRGDFLAVLGREPTPDLPPGDHGPMWKQAVLRAHREALVTGDRAIELLGNRIDVADLPEVEVEAW